MVAWTLRKKGVLIPPLRIKVEKDELEKLPSA